MAWTSPPSVDSYRYRVRASASAAHEARARGELETERKKKREGERGRESRDDSPLERSNARRSRRHRKKVGRRLFVGLVEVGVGVGVGVEGAWAGTLRVERGLFFRLLDKIV